MRIAEDLKCDLHQIFECPAEVGIACTENYVRPVENLLGVASRDAHHVADDLEREWGCQFLDEIELFVTVLLEYFVDERASFVFHVLLDASNLLRRKAFGDD